MIPTITLLTGDCRDLIKALPDESVQCIVTSPPYWGLRDYGHPKQIGLEPTFEEYVEVIVAFFRECRRVLRKDGTLWLNMGDSYVGGLRGGGNSKSTLTGSNRSQEQSRMAGQRIGHRGSFRRDRAPLMNLPHKWVSNLRPKNLIGQPWRVAFALQADGWYLRQDIIWSKPQPMPESVIDRCCKSHEYIFLLAKSPNYHFDHIAIREPASGTAHSRGNGVNSKAHNWPGQCAGNGSHTAIDHNKPGGTYKGSIPGRKDGPGQDRRSKKPRQNASFAAAYSKELVSTRNKRSVWTVPTFSYSEAHFATFPPDLIKPCILAGCPLGATVFDPFGGSGTTGAVALELGRSAILFEVSPEYVALAERRTHVTPGLAL